MTGMYPSLSRTNYWHDLSAIKASIDDSVPTFDKKLDSFFSRNAETIIDEWELVTDDDLRHLRKKLDFLSYEVGRLFAEKSCFEQRVMKLKTAIDDLERGR